jgi:4-hydroxy-3-methylbut-2-enyl diphosphate reductase
MNSGRKLKKVNLEVLNPHGFCAGVKSALDKARRLIKSGECVYCLHEIVHNELVVAELKSQGFVFVEDINEIPDGSKVLFSAHGVSPEIRAIAEAKNLKIEDATCPFVARVHKAAADFHKRGLLVIVVGKSSHAEVKGIIGEAPGAQVISSIEDIERLKLLFDKGLKVGVVSQTTMNADDVAEIVSALSRYFTVESVAEVCNATKDRQDAVKAFKGDALLVLGSVTSSNTRRLCEVASSKTFRAGNIDEVRAIDFSNINHLGVTSGASTPEEFFDSALEILENI